MHCLFKVCFQKRALGSFGASLVEAVEEGVAERMGGCLLQHKAKQNPGSVALLPGGAFFWVIVDTLEE